MTKTDKAQYTMRVQIMDKGAPLGLPITVVGRDAWMLKELMASGKVGCTSVNNPAPEFPTTFSSSVGTESPSRPFTSRTQGLFLAHMPDTSSVQT